MAQDWRMWIVLAATLTASPAPQPGASLAAPEWPSREATTDKQQVVHHLHLRIENLRWQYDELRMNYAPGVAIAGIGLASLGVGLGTGCFSSGCGLIGGALLYGGALLSASSLVVLLIEAIEYWIDRDDLGHTIDRLRADLDAAQGPAHASPRTGAGFTVAHF